MVFTFFGEEYISIFWGMVSSQVALSSVNEDVSLEFLIGVNLIGRLLSDDIQVVLLEESKVLAGLAELSLFHTLTDIPVDEGTLGIHHVVLLGDPLGEQRLTATLFPIMQTFLSALAM